MTNYSNVNRFAFESWSQWQNLSNSSGRKYTECIGLLWGREWSYWASGKSKLHLVSCRNALAWACGCQAPPEVTLSEPVKPEINHSHPSKAALHHHGDWAIWASAHCLHLSLWTICALCLHTSSYASIRMGVNSKVYICVCVLTSTEV